MEKKLPIREYIVKEFHKYPPICIEEQISKNDFECKKVIDNELDDYFVLLDLGISVVVGIHKICKKESIEDNNKFVYASLTAKMISQLLSIRKLLYSGLMDGVKCLVRPFEESSGIFFACMIDKEFLSQYGYVDKLYDNNKFWHEHISGKKLDRYINKVFDTLKFPREVKKAYFSRRDRTEKFLSQAIHSSFNSTFTTFIMPTIDGKYNDNFFGKVTTAYPNAMFELLNDINLLNTIFFKFSDNGVAFGKTDFMEKEYFKYYHFMKMYDRTFNLYYTNLKQRAVDITNKLKEVNKIYKKPESSKEGSLE